MVLQKMFPLILVQTYRNKRLSAAIPVDILDKTAIETNDGVRITYLTAGTTIIVTVASILN